MRHAIALGVLLATAVSGHAAETTFSNRANFLSSLDNSFTDTYEPSLGYASPAASYTDAGMSAVVGQTKYHSITYPDYNGVGDLLSPRPSGQVYCAGCNGAFSLDFTSTSFGKGGGFGVGFDMVLNTNTASFAPFSATIQFGDASSIVLPLTEVVDRLSPVFFGITSDKLIKSMTLAGPNPLPEAQQNGFFVMDNLTIGSASAVPEPASWAMLIIGFLFAGSAMRIRRASPLPRA